MEDLEFPICILKMELQCCQEFACRVKKRLRKVKGVYGITIVPAKGLVLVSGTAEPQVLIKAVEKIGQSPKLHAYEKDPTKAKTQFRALLKRYAREESRDEQAPAAAPAEAGACPIPVRGLGLGHSPTGVAGTCPVPVRGYGHPVQPTMPVVTLPQMVGPPGWLAPGTRPSPSQLVRYEPPKVTARKPPAPYPFNLYESKGFPKTDDPFRYFSDDHAQPCSIM